MLDYYPSTAGNQPGECKRDLEREISNQIKLINTNRSLERELRNFIKNGSFHQFDRETHRTIFSVIGALSVICEQQEDHRDRLLAELEREKGKSGAR